MVNSESQTLPELICELCRQFYALGWVSGTGGGISIRGPEGIYMAPSGVQKERLRPSDIYLLDGENLETPCVLHPPIDPSLRISECQPLFYSIFRQRGAQAVIHSHSLWAVLAAHSAGPPSLGAPDVVVGEFVCTGLEMQKGLRGYGCFDTVRIPVIANTARESELCDALTTATTAYAAVDAVLVAGHGVYVWGETWMQAKTQAECCDYLFRAVVEGRRCGLTGVGQTGAERCG